MSENKAARTTEARVRAVMIVLALVVAGIGTYLMVSGANSRDMENGTIGFLLVMAATLSQLAVPCWTDDNQEPVRERS